MPADRRRCRYCDEEISAQAKKCPYCREWLDEREHPVFVVDGDSEDLATAEITETRGRVLKKEPWSLRSGERVIARTQPYVTRLLVVLLILALPTVGITLVVAGIVWLYFKLVRPDYILTDRRLIIVRGWINRRATNILLERINEVGYRRRLDERLLWSTGRMVIETAATAGMTRIDWLKDDSRFRHAVDAQIERRRDAARARVTAGDSL